MADPAPGGRSNHMKTTSDLGESSPRLSFVLPDDLALEVRQFALATERSMAAVIRLALRELLADNESAASHTPRRGQVT